MLPKATFMIFKTFLHLACLDLFSLANKEDLKDEDQQLQAIRENLKASGSKKKNYVELKCLLWMFKEGGLVYLRPKPNKSSLRLGKFKKLAYRYFSPYPIMK